VSKSASQSLKIVQPGGYTGFWSATETPYIVEPMDLLASRNHEAVVFAGPARSGKTMGLVDGFMTHTVVCDPGDFLIVQMTQDKARDFSKTRVDRAIRHSPALKELMSYAHNDNTHDKLFRHGMWLKIGWPTASQLASSDYRYVVLTDYDRMPDNIEGEGSPFQLALKRTTTFLSRGMCMAESSPGREVLDPDWERDPKTPHAAPPTKGILDLYNQGDRRRLYWKCPQEACGEWFQPILENFSIEMAAVFCPHCGTTLDQSDKTPLNLNARWIPEGLHLDANDEYSGEARKSKIASFWMEGPAAAYQNWESLATRLKRAEEVFQTSQNQEALISAFNIDWGRPYINRVSTNRRSSSALMNRAETTPRRVVPKGVRFLIATVDVQGGQDRRFVVQVHGFGKDKETWLIDRFNIAEDNGRQIEPASRPEDWDLITKDVLHRSYKLAYDENRRMQILCVGVDTGGEAKEETSVSSQAYDWYRRLSRDGLSKRAVLLKGGSTNVQSRVRKSYPDNTGRKNRTQTARGDVPIYILATDMLKDTVAAMLDREEPGAGYLHVPSWVQRWWYEELTYEQKDSVSGKWKKPGKKPNEAFDLMAYSLAVHIIVGAEKINWENPPVYAKDPELDDNALVCTQDEHERAKELREQGASSKAAPRRRKRVVQSRL
jgi:phage terminase large subunit GpA-like protein